LEKNRFLARRQLQERLDVHYNGENSLIAQYKREKSERKQARRLETNKILEKKRAFKSERNNDKLSDKSIE
jgi:phosphopantothenoylcysteine synthetase/decarboxylase